MKKLIVLLPIFSALWLVATILIGGTNHPNYQHMSQFISELGATGAVNGQIINFIGFIPASMFLTAFVVLAIYASSKKTKSILGLLGIGVYAITLSVAALNPCDVGCRPENPSLSQIIHNLSGIVGYLGGIVGVFILASDIKQKAGMGLGAIGYALGAIALVMFFLLSPDFSFVGLAQRVFELSMYTWIILYSFYIATDENTLIK